MSPSTGAPEKREICPMLLKLQHLKWCLPLVLLLAGCEGSTMMTHTFHNQSEDSIVLQARFDSLPWYDSVSVVLPPGHMHTLYTYDMRGKCLDCFGLDSPTRWIDSIEVEGEVWAVYPGGDDGRWATEISEGRSWIQFDHTLSLSEVDFE